VPTPNSLLDYHQKLRLRKITLGVRPSLYALLENHRLPTIPSLIVVPYGRFGQLRKDIEVATKIEDDGGSGIAKKFWEWCEEQVQPFA
jgi:hypothetical protein